MAIHPGGKNFKGLPSNRDGSDDLGGGKHPGDQKSIDQRSQVNLSGNQEEKGGEDGSDGQKHQCVEKADHEDHKEPPRPLEGDEPGGEQGHILHRQEKNQWSHQGQKVP